MDCQETFLGTTAFDFYKRQCQAGGFFGLKGACIHKLKEWIGDKKVSVGDIASSIPGKLLEKLMNKEIVSSKLTTQMKELNLQGIEGVQSLQSIVGNKVEKLDLRWTSITEESLPQLKNLPNLYHLDLRGCVNISVKGFIENIPSLPQLKHLGLPNNIDTNDLKIIPWDTQFPNLECIWGPVVPADVIAKLDNLKEFKIDADTDIPPLRNRCKRLSVYGYSDIRRSLLDQINITRLEDLDMWISGLSRYEGETLISSLKNCSETLKVLSMVLIDSDPHTDFTQELLDVLPKLESLSELLLACGEAATPALLSHLPKNLKTLRLDGRRMFATRTEFKLTVESLRSYSFPENLVTLCFTSLSFFPKGSYRAICDYCTSLRELVLVDLEDDSCDIMRELKSNSIRYLEINDCGCWDTDTIQPQTDLDWISILNRLPSLSSVLLFGTSHITTQDLLDVLASRLISLSAPSMLVSIVRKVRQPPMLRYLNLTNDYLVTSSIVKTILLTIDTIEILQLENCCSLAQSIPFYLFGLKELTLRDIPVSEEDLASSLTGCIHLRVLVLDLPGKIGESVAHSIANLTSLHTLSLFLDHISPLMLIRNLTLSVVCVVVVFFLSVLRSLLSLLVL